MPSDENASHSASSPPPRSLEHPLPAGMRDLLPAEAASRRAIARTTLERFALHGYAVVMLPAFEFADVLERGLGALDPSDIIRFVEPESGEVAALRPDMTPQIARLIATRLREMPRPLRLSYEGTVLRRRSGRAHKHRQIPQVGVELAGAAGPEGDLELLAVAADAVRAVGLEKFAIDIGDAGIVRALLAGASSEVAELVTAAVARKDAVALADAARHQPLAHLDELRELTKLQGGRDAIVEGGRLLRATPAREAMERLSAVFDAAERAGLAPSLTVDLGEVRGFAYYTGPIFQLLAPGPGESIGSGGRYDDLLGRFGAPMPASGFALDLDRLTLALRVAGAKPTRPQSVVVVGPPNDARVAEMRHRGVMAVACANHAIALAYARAWGFTHVLDSDLVEVKGA
jgi:ATP phosphoribosyltransferase regulatory subunit